MLLGLRSWTLPQLKGISFDISGDWDTSDGYIRVMFKHAGEDEGPYVNISSTGSKVARMSSAYVFFKEDEGYDYEDYPCYPEQVEAIQFNIPSNDDDYSEFDFCISNIKALVE